MNRTLAYLLNFKFYRLILKNVWIENLKYLKLKKNSISSQAFLFYQFFFKTSFTSQRSMKLKERMKIKTLQIKWKRDE